MSEPETPVETVHRLWPGEWSVVGQHMTRCLPVRSPVAAHIYPRPRPYEGDYEMLGRFWGLLRPEPERPVGPTQWIGMVHVYGDGRRVLCQYTGDLDTTIIETRKYVQTMARDFARAAGLEVPHV